MLVEKLKIINMKRNVRTTIIKTDTCTQQFISLTWDLFVWLCCSCAVLALEILV